ncbi:recombinase family protein [Clostridioides difficile]|nr:recombinase family protein [Clostridioides difficile]
MKSALYVRVSTHYQVDKDSLPFQRQELINYSKYVLGIDDYEIFEDAGYSGKNTDRPAFKDMMNRVRNKEFTHILVWKIDRISRNLLDFCDTYEEIKKLNVIFISKNEQFDTSSAMGEAMLKIILVFAELERQLTAERVYSIMLSRAEKGLWNGANCPIGYTYDEESKFPQIDTQESIIVKMIYDKYEELKSTSKVSSYLNSNNIKTKRNGIWTSKTICDIIRNPFYKGTYRYNYRESARGKIKDEKEWIIIDNNHSKIISTEQWQNCNDIMNTNGSKVSASFRKNVINTHIFGSFLVCGCCGNRFVSNLDRPRKNGYKPSSYRCSSKFKDVYCNSKIITDITLGPFIFNYILNLIKVHIYGVKNIKELEKRLLQGNTFKNIVGIKQDELENMYICIYVSKNQKIRQLNRNNIKKKNSNMKDTTIKLLLSEKEKFENALNKLEDLFLFSKDMSKKQYLLKKVSLKENLSAINNKLEIESKKADNNSLPNDMSFLKTASNFLLSFNLLNEKTVDYKRLVMNMDKQILKDFIESMIDNITIKNGIIHSIKFKNNLTNTFIYK